ncbi:MAG TPA: DUF2332 domain-containing protein [Acidimicrobiales bacterium]|nr:DUF2332 domain-containing protein [Acidimicrobiales bacterium]
MTEPTEALAQLWEWFATTQCRGYSPLYERISMAVARDADLLGALQHTRPSSHMPPALLGAVHYLLLGGLEHPLAEVYAGRSGADPATLFIELCRDHWQELSSILATRHIQTNECGRSAVIGPGLTWLASRLDGRLALVDVGASAGLNLLCDSYLLDYGDHGATGPADSPVRISCRVLGGDPPIAERLPPFAARVGIDRSPVDLTDPADARWLLACVWPDTGRLERTAASIELARHHLPRVVEGDANDVLGDVLHQLPPGAVAVIVTTWAFAYLTIEERQRFVEALSSESNARPIAWLSAEGAGTVDAFAVEPSSGEQADAPDVLGAMTFESGTCEEHLLGRVHPHGTWIDWNAAYGSSPYAQRAYSPTIR